MASCRESHTSVESNYAPVYNITYEKIALRSKPVLASDYVTNLSSIIAGKPVMSEPDSKKRAPTPPPKPLRSNKSTPTKDRERDSENNYEWKVSSVSYVTVTKFKYMPKYFFLILILFIVRNLFYRALNFFLYLLNRKESLQQIIKSLVPQYCNHRKYLLVQIWFTYYLYSIFFCVFKFLINIK